MRLVDPFGTLHVFPRHGQGGKQYKVTLKARNVTVAGLGSPTINSSPA